MAKAKGTVGVVGLGIMGGAFARHLVTAGWRVIGYDPDPKARRAAARAGVEIAKDAQDLVATVPVMITGAVTTRSWVSLAIATPARAAARHALASGS